MSIFPVVREGYVFILSALVLGGILGLAVHPYLAIPLVVLAFYFAYFFRNPKREIPSDPLAIVSPADGTVQEVVSLDDDDFLKQRCKKVVIFLSVFDVHVNRSPIEGEIKIQKYVCGRFKPAYKDSVGFENERHMIGIENPRLRVTVTQIAGILARRTGKRRAVRIDPLRFVHGTRRARGSGDLCKERRQSGRRRNRDREAQ